MSSMEPDLSSVPYIGQIFSTEQEAFEFYKAYGGKEGFGVRRGYLHKFRNTQMIKDRMFFCDKEGLRKDDPKRMNIKKHRDETRCDCGAKMSIAYDTGLEKYVVRKFEAAHIHLLQPPECVHMIRCHRNFKFSQASTAETALKSGLSLKDTFEFMGNEAGGIENLGFMKEDLKRHLQTKRERTLEKGEAAALLDYFQNQCKRNPSFYSAYLLDDEAQITNIFWANANMILDYANYGDVITFDTTYKTNNFHRPCGVFAGLSSHRKTLIFGGALLYDETSASFKWLFSTFLHCMSGVKPKTIFTDQAQAIANGLKEVMPESKHLLCTWHLTQNLRKHYGRLVKENICQMWNDYIYMSMSPSEFDTMWKVFVDYFDVADDPWFKAKYDLREKWAVAFLKNTLTLGMSSTQLSESLNASLKDWLKPSVDIITFFDNFAKVVTKRRYQERKMVYEGRHKFLAQGLELSPMLKQANEVYTLPIFKRFHDEYQMAAGLVCSAEEDTWIDGEKLYRVALFNDLSNVFKVVSKKEMKIVSCSCAMFQMTGYLCCHCIKILDKLDIKTITNEYILKRWTKDSISEIVLDFEGLKIDCEPEMNVSKRYHSLYHNLVTMGAHAAQCKAATDYLASIMPRVAKKIDELCLNDKGDSEMPPDNPAGEDISSYGELVPLKLKAKFVAKNEGDKTHLRPKNWYEIYKGKKYKKSFIRPPVEGTDEDAIEIQLSQQPIAYQNSQEFFPEQYIVRSDVGTIYHPGFNQSNIPVTSGLGIDIVQRHTYSSITDGGVLQSNVPSGAGAGTIGNLGFNIYSIPVTASAGIDLREGQLHMHQSYERTLPKLNGKRMINPCLDFTWVFNEFLDNNAPNQNVVIQMK